jgi:hypothetical protein
VVVAGCHSGAYSGARLVAMGGGEHGVRGRFAQAREGLRRCAQGVLRSTRDVVSPFLGDRARDLHGHGEAMVARPP